MAEIRCRAGDIAILLSMGNVGKLARVIERAPAWVEEHYGAPAWEIESLGSPIQTYDFVTKQSSGGKTRTRTPDHRMIPLRDGPEPLKKRRKSLEKT